MERQQKIDELIKSGLSEDQAEVYLALLSRGRTTASKLRPFTSLSRPMLYRVLDELIDLKLASKEDAPQMVSLFEATHPIALREILKKKREEVTVREQALENVLTPLISDFTALSGKPGIQFYDGKDGVWEVLMDSLTATEEILAYSDIEAIRKYIPDLNAEYAATREDQKVKKRALVIDTPETRKFLKSYDPEITQQKLISAETGATAFKTTMQIYDDKVSYITLSDEYIVGIIITNQQIADTQKYLFDSMWNNSSGEII